MSSDERIITGQELRDISFERIYLRHIDICKNADGTNILNLCPIFLNRNLLDNLLSDLCSPYSQSYDTIVSLDYSGYGHQLGVAAAFFSNVGNVEVFFTNSF